MTDPLSRNRLSDEESPYLRQHADNPVHWQPWDETALEAARERDRPIFLSIGYAACHWCHVMADESFADETVAAVVNEHFVPIKVDREERPAVDTIYMTACQLATGRGGWPLSAWLTPEGEPFQVTTYVPPEPRGGQPGFLELCRSIAEAWETDRATVRERAGELTAAVRRRLDGPPDGQRAADPPASELLSAAAGAARRRADTEHGGFGDEPKFPQPPRLAVLTRATARLDRPDHRELLVGTLDAMADGGLYDHVGGGFHRYCVDREWTVPHFEKMLYDNATLPLAYLDGYRLTGEDRYATVVRETLEFLERELTHPDGGFYSTLDAQSEDRTGERAEGAFYVWTPDTLEAAVADPLTADLLAARFGVTAAGNFEGATVLTRATDVETLADRFDLSAASVQEHLADGRAALFEARSARSRPPRDEKVLAGWNGLAIEACAEAAMVLQEDRYLEQATAALGFVREHLWDGRLSRRYADGVVAVDGTLEDHAFLAAGALRCHEATGEVSHLSFALALARAIRKRFWDADAGTFYLTPADGEPLLTRPTEIADGATPSASGVAAMTLLALDGFTDEDLAGPAETVLGTHRQAIEGAPLEHATCCLAADRLAGGLAELTVAAESIPPDWRARIAADYRPDRLLTRRPPGDDGLEDWLDRLDLASAPPIWAGRSRRGADPTLYACRERTCSAPLHAVEDALEWLDEPASPL